jgi:hypothetical protein
METVVVTRDYSLCRGTAYSLCENSASRRDNLTRTVLATRDYSGDSAGRRDRLMQTVLVDVTGLCG